MQNANELLGFLHGAYGLGATISPLIATSMVTKGSLPWYTFYYLMVHIIPILKPSILLTQNKVGLAVLEAAVCIYFFKDATGAVHRAKHPVTQSSSGHSNTKDALINPITWICALFLLCYVGVEVSLGGWLVTFMLVVRHGAPFASGIVVTGFWLGLTFGRVILGFVTGKIGEKLAITIYVVLSGK